MSQVVTTADINDAIANTMRAAVTIPIVKSFDELPEGIFDLPMVLVHWFSCNEDFLSRGTDRIAGQGKVRAADDTFYVDLYARQRSLLDEDIGEAIRHLDAMRAVMYQQDTAYFGLSQIQAVRWSARRAIFVHSTTSYSGVRFTINTKVY